MDQQWIQAHSLGGNTYLATLQLIRHLSAYKTPKILDLGCGKCLSSILLAEKLGAEVWAIDNQAPVDENFQILRQFEHLRVIPLQLDATNLPFPHNYFDCIVAVNATYYFGTDDKFLPYISKFLKKDGIMAITDICFTQEIESVGEIPALLKADFFYYFQHIHALEWWKRKWEKTGLFDILVAEHCENIGQMKEAYLKMTEKAPDAFTHALLQDDGHVLDFFTLIGKKNDLPPFLE